MAARKGDSTPPLRNVALTAPYMHNGAYLTLEAAVRHHLNPPAALAAYDVETLSAVMLEEDSGDPEVHRAALEAPAYDMPVIELSEAQVADLLAFLNALTSPTALDLSDTIPESVPSGLPVGGTIP